jgi:hypothetical protein
MRRFKLLGVVLLALFAFGVLTAASASATIVFLLAEWLAGGVGLTAELLVESEGELELVSLNAGGFGITTKLLCSGILDGTIGPNGLDFISDLLTLAGVEIPLTALTGTALLCLEVTGGNCTEPEVWASGLGWNTLLELMEVNGVSFFVDLILNGGWYAQCLVLGVTASETCTAAEAAVEVTNEAGGVIDNTFSDAFQELAGLKLANCSVGGNETGEVNGLGTTSESGVTLTASSTG